MLVPFGPDSCLAPKLKLNFLLSYGTLYIVTHEQINQYQKKMERLYQRANAFCATHPDADRNVLIQSWRMQEESPRQKIEMALLRGQAMKRKNELTD